MNKILLILLCSLMGYAFAESKVLHVSTIPSNADIYIDEVSPDHSREPAYVSPAFIDVNDSLASDVLISLFNPGFTDTTIRVRLSAKDTSFIIVSQQPILDEGFLQAQQSDISKRKRRVLGKDLMKLSLVPFALGLLSGAITYYEISKADDSKKAIKNSSIESDRNQDARDEFRSYQRKARTAKGITYASFITGVSLLSIGFIFSF